MKPRKHPVLVLAVGNDILGDDGVGMVAGRALRESFADGADIVETSEAGLALLDLMAGYRRVLLLDSISTGEHPPGTVLEFAREDFDKVVGPCPHYAGLPEVLELARRLAIDFPEEIRVLALEIEPPRDFREALSEGISRVVPEYVQKAREILQHWIPPQAG